MIILRIAIFVLGVAFLLPGLIGVFRPERLAEALALAPATPAGIVSIRALIGAPYLAMAVMTVFAAVGKQWAWLAPIAATEGFMAVTRILAGYMGDFDRAALTMIGMETVACVILSLGAIQSARAAR